MAMTVDHRVGRGGSGWTGVVVRRGRDADDMSLAVTVPRSRSRPARAWGRAAESDAAVPVTHDHVRPRCGGVRSAVTIGVMNNRAHEHTTEIVVGVDAH